MRSTTQCAHPATLHLLVTTLVAAVACVAAPAARAGQFSDAELGYSLTIPDEWSAIPQTEIDAFYQRAINPQNPPPWTYCAAFQPTSHKRSFQFPYILVQNQPYPGGKHIDSISESELKQIVAGATGINTKDLRNSLSPEASKLLLSVNSPAASYSTHPPGFQMSMTMAAAGAGTVRLRSVALVGRDHCIMVHFYAPQAQWEQYAPTFQKIADSFRLSPQQQVSLGGFNWDRVGNSAAIGAIIGGVVGLFVWIFKRAGKRAA